METLATEAVILLVIGLLRLIDKLSRQYACWSMVEIRRHS
jgi:hypothetical protein